MINKKFLKFFASFVLIGLIWLLGSSFTLPSPNNLVYSELPSNDDFYSFESTDFLSIRLGYPGLDNIDYTSLSGNNYYLLKSNNWINSDNYSSLIYGSLSFDLNFNNVLSNNDISFLQNFPLFKLRAYNDNWEYLRDIASISLYDFIMSNNILVNGTTYSFNYNSIQLVYEETGLSSYSFKFYLVHNNTISKKSFIYNYTFDTFNLNGAYYFSLDTCFYNGSYYQKNNSVDFIDWTFENTYKFYVSNRSNKSAIDFKFYAFKTGYLTNIGDAPSLLDGYEDGYSNGYLDGYNAANGNDALNWEDFITKLIGSPLVFLSSINSYSLFGFTIFGLLGIMLLVSTIRLLFRIFR